MANFNGGQLPAWQSFPGGIICPGKGVCPGRRDGIDWKGNLCIHNDCDAYRAEVLKAERAARRKPKSAAAKEPKA